MTGRTKLLLLLLWLPSADSYAVSIVSNAQWAGYSQPQWFLNGVYEDSKNLPIMCVSAASLTALKCVSVVRNGRHGEVLEGQERGSYISQGVIVGPTTVRATLLPGVGRVVYLYELKQDTDSQIQILVTEMGAQDVDNFMVAVEVVEVTRDPTTVANEDGAAF